MPLPTLQAPPAMVSPAPDAKEAEAALLEAFDYDQAPPPDPKLKGAPALAYRWLHAAATFDPSQGTPSHPFASGQDRKEAEALLHLMKASKEQLGVELKALPLRTSGTALALWRWGQVQVRRGTFDGPLRQLWEDRLLTSGPNLTRGYALRHALCWALADKNDARLASVRSKVGSTSEETLKGFQMLFGLLGNPSPSLRLWSLPGLEYHDLRLDQLGANRVWVHSMDQSPLPELPSSTVWIIPSGSGGLDERDASLPEALAAEAQALAERLKSSGRVAQFAPSQSDFGRLGLNWFPILIDLNGKGEIQSIRMGDAAPTAP